MFFHGLDNELLVARVGHRDLCNGHGKQRHANLQPGNVEERESRHTDQLAHFCIQPGGYLEHL